MHFDKTPRLFPYTPERRYLAHCSISPLYTPAAEQAITLLRDQQHYGVAHFGDYYPQALEAIKEHGATMLKTSPANLAVVKNTSEAISMIANGYPFAAGDEVISFVHEYPANHYPWRLQERRGVQVKLLPNIPNRPDIDPALVGSWSMEALAAAVTPRTRVVALSHVQFTSGFAANLPQLGAFCHQRGIDLIIDAAQSLGSMPVFPEEWHIAAVASAGWKWLLGPFGIGILYANPALREKIALTQIGAETMTQGMDYLDHTWAPHQTAKRFEYSSSPPTLVAALARCIQEVPAHYGAEALFAEIIRLQDIFLAKLNHPDFKPLLYPSEHRSGILPLACPDPEAVGTALAEQGIITAPRGGVLRIAPHFYNTEEDMLALASAINAWPGKG